MAATVAAAARNTQTINTFVMNGGFEFPPLPEPFPYIQLSLFPPPLGGWSIGPSNCATGTEEPTVKLVSNAYWDAAEGLQSIDLNGDIDAPPSISQTVITAPGLPHRITWQESANYEAGPSITPAYQFSIPSLSLSRRYTVPWDARRSARNMMYTQRSVDFVPTGAQTDIRFDACISTEKGAVIDNVTVTISVPSITPFPPPAPAQAATGGGLTGGEVAGISIGLIGGAGLLVFLIYMLRRGGGQELAAALRDWTGGRRRQEPAVVQMSSPFTAVASAAAVNKSIV